MTREERRADQRLAAQESAKGVASGAAIDPASVLERMLAQGELDAPAQSFPHEAVISAWSDTAGVLAGGRAVRLGASCLLRPAPGDRVLVWRGSDGQGWVLAILQRADEDAAAVLATSHRLAIEAPRVGISAQAVHIAAEDLLTSTRNRHAVEDTRTVTSRVRVTQVGTDIRRVTTSDETVAGTFLQRAGTWISSTTREARLRARTFLFD